MNVDLQELKSAFLKWHLEWKATPEDFYTHAEERADDDLDKVCTEKAAYFMHILKEVKNV